MPRSVEPSAVKVVASRKNKGELRAKGAGSVPSADRLHRLPLRVCVQEPDNSGDTFEFAAITPPSPLYRPSRLSSSFSRGRMFPLSNYRVDGLVKSSAFFPINRRLTDLRVDSPPPMVEDHGITSVNERYSRHSSR